MLKEQWQMYQYEEGLHNKVGVIYYTEPEG